MIAVRRIRKLDLQAIMDMINNLLLMKVILHSNNKEPKQFKIIFSIFQNFMKDFKFNLIVYKLFIPNKFKGICKKGKIKILTELFMD
jgi:hypothetical protein